LLSRSGLAGIDETDDEPWLRSIGALPSATSREAFLQSIQPSDAIGAEPVRKGPLSSLYDRLAEQEPATSAPFPSDHSQGEALQLPTQSSDAEFMENNTSQLPIFVQEDAISASSTAAMSSSASPNARAASNVVRVGLSTKAVPSSSSGSELMETDAARNAWGDADGI